MINDCIAKYLQSSNMINNVHNGFRKSKSFCNNLLAYLEVVAKVLDEL